MNNENLEYHKTGLEIRKFPEEMKADLEAHIREGSPMFTLTFQEERDDKLLYAELHYNKHKEHDFYYFNKYDVMLVQNDEVLKSLSVRSDYKITLEEAYSFLLHGDKVAVYKENIRKDGADQEAGIYNAYISVVTAEDGTTRLNTYHDNYYAKYPFDLEASLRGLPAKIKELTEQNLPDALYALKHAKPFPVTVIQGKTEVKGFLTINAKAGRISILDQQMEPMTLGQAQSVKQDAPAQEQSEVKKKPWQQQGQQQRIKPKSKGHSFR